MLGGSSLRATVCALCVLTFLFCAELGVAQPAAPVELSWQAPDSCPQQAEVEEQIRTLVGTTGAQQPLSPLHAKGVIELYNDHFQLILLIERNSIRGTRTIESNDCQSLGKAAAVVLGLLARREISSGHELTETDISGQSEPSPKVPDVEIPPPLPLPPSPPAISHERTWFLLARGPGLSIDVWTLPRPSFGSSLSLGVTHDDWRAFVTGGLWLTQSKSASGAQPYQADFRHFSLEASMCRGLTLGAFELAPCAVLALDDVKAQASGGKRIPTARSIAWLSIGGGVSGYWHIHRTVAFVISASGRITTDRPQFVVTNYVGATEVHRVPFGTLLSSLGVEWTF